MGPQLRAVLDNQAASFDMPAESGAWDLSAVFPTARQVVLEIGSGMGEAAVAMALADPATAVLCVEVHLAGVAATVRAADDAGLQNLRIHRDDAVRVLRERIPPGALDGIRVWFPDPWPKSRHHKRRLIREDFVELAVSRLAVGGSLHCATDVADYASVMVEILGAEPRLTCQWSGARPEWRPETKFEVRARLQGRATTDLIYRRT